jgi:glucose-1-phosphate cytidylyltransferase
MKVGILAGGLGTRLSEETTIKPKPMVEIGGRPILWHIMQIYSAHGFNEFVVALGYKGSAIKDYFLDYRLRASSLTVDLMAGTVICHPCEMEPWKVHLLDTGLNTQTGGRVKRLAQFAGQEPFMLTYGDGVADVDLQRLLEFHRQHGKLATITAARTPARFGALYLQGDLVSAFAEKPPIGEGWINGGFFVLEPEVADYIHDDQTVFEREPLERLAREGQLAAYRHEGFWHCMDNLRDVQLLEGLWAQGQAPWKMW